MIMFPLRWRLIVGFGDVGRKSTKKHTRPLGIIISVGIVAPGEVRNPSIDQVVRVAPADFALLDVFLCYLIDYSDHCHRKLTAPSGLDGCFQIHGKPGKTCELLYSI